MFDFETRPHHFFIPMVIAIIGGLFARLDTWEVVGYVIIGIALTCAAWLFYHSYKKHEYEMALAEQNHLAEIIKLDASKQKTIVAIEKTDLTGFLHKNFTEINIPPAKMKLFAKGVLIDGKKLTIREWTPLKAHKLFSDGEWRRLIAFMKNPDWEDAHIKFIVPINPSNDKEGYELTAAGRKWLQNILEDSVLTPTLA